MKTMAQLSKINNALAAVLTVSVLADIVVTGLFWEYEANTVREAIGYVPGALVQLFFLGIMIYLVISLKTHKTVFVFTGLLTLFYVVVVANNLFVVLP